MYCGDATGADATAELAGDASEPVDGRACMPWPTSSVYVTCFSLQYTAVSALFVPLSSLVIGTASCIHVADLVFG